MCARTSVGRFRRAARTAPTDGTRGARPSCVLPLSTVEAVDADGSEAAGRMDKPHAMRAETSHPRRTDAEAGPAAAPPRRARRGRSEEVWYP